jgi:predicted nucleic acid-binding protein
MLIGEPCLQLKATGKLDPIHSKHYNDVTIAAAARQVGATVITKNAKDFQIIQSVIDFDFEGLS